MIKFIEVVPPIVLRSTNKLIRFQKRKLLHKRIGKYRKLHLGSGLINVFDDWLNLDFRYDNLKRKNYCKWDLTIPIKSSLNSIDYIFTEHFVEHIKKYQFITIFEDLFKSMTDGGVLRISTPDLAILLLKYHENDLKYWKKMNWEPESATDLLNEGMHSWGHCYIWSFEELRDVLLKIGFTNVYRVNYRQSAYEVLRNLERREFHEDLIIEAIK